MTTGAGAARVGEPIYTEEQANPAIGWKAPHVEHEQEFQPRRLSRIDELAGQVQRLLSNMRIAVIYGGNKADEGSVLYRTYNPRSWKSYEPVAADIADSLRRLGCRYVSLMADDMRLAQRMRDEAIQFAWLNTGGVQGYCAVSHAPAIMEMLGVPYIGHEPLTAGILDSKHTFKRQLLGLGIPTGRFITWHESTGRFDPRSNAEFQTAFRDYAGPFIVKPVSGRASLNVEFVENVDDIAQVAADVYRLTHSHVLIEEYLSGREYCVAACGPVIARRGKLTRLDGPFTFAVVERVWRKMNAYLRPWTNAQSPASVSGTSIR